MHCAGVAGLQDECIERDSQGLRRMRTHASKCGHNINKNNCAVAAVWRATGTPRVHTHAPICSRSTNKKRVMPWRISVRSRGTSGAHSCASGLTAGPTHITSETRLRCRIASSSAHAGRRPAPLFSYRPSAGLRGQDPYFILWHMAIQYERFEFWNDAAINRI